jgi:hypothetical protein
MMARNMLTLAAPPARLIDEQGIDGGRVGAVFAHADLDIAFGLVARAAPP